MRILLLNCLRSLLLNLESQALQVLELLLRDHGHSFEGLLSRVVDLTVGVVLRDVHVVGEFTS